MIKNRRNKEKKLQERLEQLSNKLDASQDSITIQETVTVKSDTLNSWRQEATELLQELREADPDEWYQIESQMVERLNCLSAALETLGREVGQFQQCLHEEHGVRFHLNATVEEFRGADGFVSEVELANSTRLPADLVIVGIGVRPATDYLTNTGISINDEDDSILVNEYLQTSHPDIYAAGDIARFPNNNNGTIRIEHWRVAQQHGFVAAHNMLNHTDRVNTHIPFFWTSQWEIRLRYVGNAQDWDEVVYRGNVEDGKFIAFYLKDRMLQAAAGIGFDVEMDALEIILKHDLPLSIADMQNPDFDIVALVREP